MIAKHGPLWGYKRQAKIEWWELSSAKYPWQAILRSVGVVRPPEVEANTGLKMVYLPFKEEGRSYWAFESEVDRDKFCSLFGADPVKGMISSVESAG